jgi:transcriptional regulator GlxA family with amidase domain
MAERTLSRSFRGQMGRTLPQFANELRIGRARRMLMETSLSVTAVAQRCGFRNLSNFNTQFRRLAGQTPQSFRQACRGLSPSL